MISQDENIVAVNDFLEKGDVKVLVIYVNQQGQLTPIHSFPTSTKQKVQYSISLIINKDLMLRPFSIVNSFVWTLF